MTSAGAVRFRYIAGLVVLLPLLAAPGVFLPGQLFFARDLSAFFWPAHLYARSALLAGSLPLWDPYAASGQCAIGNPILHLLFPPAIVLRLLPPELGFKLFVALPASVAAGGMLLLLVRRCSRPASIFGALCFALSGPMLSSQNMPNLAWAAALMPLVLWAAERVAEEPRARRVAVLAIVVAMQVLAGEALLLIATGALALAVGAVMPGDRRQKLTTVTLIGTGFAAGAGLAAAGLLPALDVASRSGRAFRSTGALWSLHPLTLVEAVAPGLWGSFLDDAPRSEWATALNGARTSFFVSVYLGPAFLAVAAAGAFTRRRAVVMWTAAAALFLLLALGGFTPLYGLLSSAIPGAGTLRYPAKFLLPAVLAACVLAALGVDRLNGSEQQEAAPRRAWLVPSIVLLLLALGGAIVATLASSEDISGIVARIGGISVSGDAARAFEQALPTAALRVAIVAGVAAIFAALCSSSAARRRACAVLAVLALADLLAANARLNPVMDAGFLSRPPWLDAIGGSPEPTSYSEGLLSTTFGDAKYDGPGPLGMPARLDAPRRVALQASRTLLFPSPWRIRQPLTYDVAQMLPNEHDLLAWEAAKAARPDRLRLLMRLGVGEFLLTSPPAPGVAPIADVDDVRPFGLYESRVAQPRVSVVSESIVEPSAPSQAKALLSPDFDPSQSLLLFAPPPLPAGEPGDARPPAAVLTGATDTSVEIEAQAGAGGGFVLLLDAYDPNWRAEVDGKPALVQRANCLFRAVRIAPGAHHISMRYVPRPFYSGIGLSAATAVLLLIVCFARTKTREGDARGE